MKFLKSCLLFLGLSLVSTYGLAYHHANTAPVANANPQVLIKRTYHWFENVVNSHRPLSLAEVQTYFAPNYKQFTNGRLVASGSKGIYHRIIEMQQMYAKVHFRNLTVRVMNANATGQTVSLCLKAKDGHRFTVNPVSIAQFDNSGRLVRFWEAFQGNDVAK